jgi:hypothetical protein
MNAPQAPWAMIAMPRAGRIEGEVGPTVSALNIRLAAAGNVVAG